MIIGPHCNIGYKTLINSSLQPNGITYGVAHKDREVQKDHCTKEVANIKHVLGHLIPKTLESIVSS
jgi:hypothetical protein